MDRLSEDEPNVSLDFVDADHVLLTFNRKRMFRRLDSCPPNHGDRLIHAAILDVHTGKAVKEADWYLHDRHRYLWPMGQGKFLLRRLNDLYVVDANLHETLLLSSPKDLRSVSVTPDGRQIIVETATDPPPAPAPPSAKPQPRFEAKFLDASTLATIRTVPLNEAVHLTGAGAGYVDLVHKGNIWLLRFGPGPKRRRNIARVRSQTVPDVLYSSDNSLLIGRCPSQNCDYSVTAFSLSGQRHWRQHWPRYRIDPSIARSQDNSRFAVSTLRLAVRPATPTAPVPDDEIDVFQPIVSQRDVFEQEVQVFETASGGSVLSVGISPAIMTGQNFSLSPDGRSLAVLEGSGMELFELPPVSSEEQSKFAELISKIPDLYASTSDPDTEAGPSRDAAAAASIVPNSAGETLTDRAAAVDPESATESANSETSSSDQNPASSIPKVGEQNAEADSQPTATIHVSTRAVLVDVVVTDSKGHPVKGLRDQDFQITEDGKAQAVRSFKEFSDGIEDNKDKEPSTAFVKATTPSRNVFSNKTHPPDTGAVTLVLFDMLNTPGQDQSFARQQLIKFLAAKPKNLQFALCTMSMGKSYLHLIQGFTPDETVLLAAAKGKNAVPKEAAWQVSMAGTTNAVDTVADLAQAGPTSGFQGLLSVLQQSQAEQQVTDTNERAAITLDSMMLLVRYLSGIPGRKNIVWLSGSFPISISATTNSGNIALDNPNYAYKIKRVTNLLADSQIAVYPVDVRGLTGGAFGADSAGGMGGPAPNQVQDLSGNSLIVPTDAIPQSMQALAQQAEERDTLLEFATQTGGKAFYNTNGIGQAIATAAEQGSNYYTLSYSPANKNYDGRFRKIKVHLDQKGYALYYRQGYYADDIHPSARQAELNRRARAVAMQHGSPLSHEMVFSVRVSPIGSKTKADRAKLGEVLLASAKQPTLPALVEAQHYLIDYSLDGSELRFVPGANATYRNTVTLMVTSFDREGKMLTGVSSAGTREVQAAAYEKLVAGEFGVQQEIDIPVEAASMRIGIQDQMSNRLGTVDIPLPVPPDPELRRVRNTLPEIEPD